MSKSYDRDTAALLVPLLMGICSEIAERTASAHRLKRSIRTLESAADGQPGAVEDLLNLRAELANHRREIRLAKAEVTSLGCAFDESRPQRVLIPGENGSLASGYAWDLGTDSLVETTVP